MKIESRQFIQELKEGFVWPVYWIYGPETYRIREACAYLARALIGEGQAARKWAEDRLEGSVCTPADVLASAQSIPLGGGTRVVWVREAHLIRDPDVLASLFGSRQKIGEIPSVTVFLAKDLDARRKFSKALIEKAAVLECAAVAESERESWVASLAKGRGLDLARLPLEALVRAEPWSLDWVRNELEKWDLSEQALAGSGEEVLVGGGGELTRVGERFIEAFLERRALAPSLACVSTLGSQPEQALPVLGLLAWNVRMMALLAARSRSLKLAPFLENKLRRAAARWQANEIQDLQSALAGLDFALKQTPQEPLALWGVLVHQFCKSA
jgi:DNA polymerase III delta subunit